MRHAKTVAASLLSLFLGALVGYSAATLRWGEFSLTLSQSNDLSDAQVLLKIIDLIDADNLELARFRMLAVASVAGQPIPRPPPTWHERAIMSTIGAIPVDREVEQYIADEVRKSRSEVLEGIQRICGMPASSAARYAQLCRR